MITLFGPDEPTFLEKLKKSVSKTSSDIATQVDNLFAADSRLDPEQLRRFENALLAADLGVTTTRELLDAVRDTAGRDQARDPDHLRTALKNQLLNVLN